jgi:hypothetical protein
MTRGILAPLVYTHGKEVMCPQISPLSLKNCCLEVKILRKQHTIIIFSNLRVVMGNDANIANTNSANRKQKYVNFVCEQQNISNHLLLFE